MCEVCELITQYLLYKPIQITKARCLNMVMWNSKLYLIHLSIRLSYIPNNIKNYA